MKKVFSILTVMIATGVLVSGFMMVTAEDVAVITRVRKEVQVKPENGDWYEAKRADRLKNGDNLKTGQQSSAVVKFLDGSILRVRANSELVVYSDRAGNKIDKNVQVDVGTIGFNVRKRADEGFRFSSPTSVASIRGTDGGFGSDDLRDFLLINTGTADFQNKATGVVLEVIAGQIGLLDKQNNTFTSRELTESDKALLESGEEGDVRTLKIDFQMPDGTIKSLEIEYVE